MAIASSAPEKVVGVKATEKSPVVAVIYDSTIEPKSKRLGSKAGLQNRKPIIRPSLTLMGLPRSSEGSDNGMAKVCPLLRLQFGTTILEDRTLWEEVKEQPYVQKLLANGQLSEIEATSNEGATFASFNLENVEILLENLYHQDFIEPCLEGEKRKEVFRMAEEKKSECIRRQEANK